MIYREREKLTIIQIQDDEEKISFERLENVILDGPSNVIYCERNGKLYGIITMGDIARARDKFVSINTQFTCLDKGDYMKARNIFFEKHSINALPVVDSEKGRMIGDWSRWDDLKFSQYIHRKNGLCKIYGKDSYIAFAYSDDVTIVEKRKIYSCFCKYLADSGALVKNIKYQDIANYISDVDALLVVDEDEFRAVDTWLTYMKESDLGREKIMTCMSFLNRKIIAASLEAYFYEISKQGIYLINLYFEENEQYRKLRKDIAKKFALKDYKVSGKLHPDMTEEFFDDLYTEEYVNDIMNIKYSVVNVNGCSMLKDCQGKFLNVTNGERFTIGVPEKYKRTIYFVGPCYIYGHYVEDANTIESFLQNRLNHSGYEIRVVNCGSPAYSGHIIMQLARIKRIPLKKGDIIVGSFTNTLLKNTFNLNLTNILKEQNINPGWIVDELRHCNHKVNALYADAIYNALQPILDKAVDGQGELIKQDRDFIRALYIDQYFSDFEPSEHKKIGSIVMNCNPFTYGHRHLIERALEIVDCLIIFVVEEDQSLFTFNERFAMVCEGVEDLHNVIVVPSGPFILSQTTFPEYFIKTADEDLMVNVEGDITVFAERIAPHLHITYRFVGEEPEDGVTNEYNMAMKRILPKNGIELIEIPRKKQEGKCISASSVRVCLERNDIDGFKRLVPESTTKILLQ